MQLSFAFLLIFSFFVLFQQVIVVVAVEPVVVVVVVVVVVPQDVVDSEEAVVEAASAVVVVVVEEEVAEVALEDVVHQVVVAVEVLLAVVLEEDVVVVVVAVQVLKVAQTLSSNHIVTKVSLLLKEKNIFWSQRIWCLENLFMEKRESVLNHPPKKMKQSVKRPNIVFGTLSDPKWLQVFWAVWTTFTSALARRFFIWVLPVVPVSVTLPMLLVQKERCMQLNSVTEVDVI